MLDDLQQYIRDYQNQLGSREAVRDSAYLRSAFVLAGSDEVVAALEAMVRSGGREGVSFASRFIEDALIQGAGPDEFRYRYHHSSLLAAVREQIYVPDFFVRHNALTLLGRRGPTSNWRVLADALPWYLEHDPLNLDRLLFDLLFLQPRLARVSGRKRLVGQFVSSHHFLSRWAALDYLWQRELQGGSWNRRGPKEQSWVRQYLRRLAQDTHPWVRAETRWRLDTLLNRKFRGVRRRQPPRTVVDLRPNPQSPCYFEVSLYVHNYLGISGEAGYDAALVEALGRYAIQRPLVPGYPEAWYGGFADWRRAESTRGQT